MKKAITITLHIVLLLTVTVVSKVQATTFPNPDSSLYGNDIGGNGYFIPNGDPFFTIRFFELSAGGTFGMYFKSDPNNLITLLDSTDAPLEIATVDLANGIVYDWDQLAVQSTFTPLNSPMGFFYTPAIQGFPTLFTDPFLNSGFDTAAVYPVLGVIPDAYLLSFIFTDLSNQGALHTLSWHAISGVDNFVVPEPGTLALLSSGLLGIFFGIRARKSRQ